MTKQKTKNQLTNEDKQCLTAVRQLAAELGRLPTKAELENYEALKLRFGNWPNIMVLAGLKRPRSERRPANRERDLRNEEQRRLKKEACGVNKP